MAVSPQQSSAQMREFCALAPVIPVLVIDNVEQAVPLAQSLVAGGLPVLEVTLRTDCALDAITRMAAVPGAVVGAGTLLSPRDVEAAKSAGALFGVSPGATPELLAAGRAHDLPLLPGAATASEVMTLAGLGFDMLKFFPAVAAGGLFALKGFAGPFPQVSFCPTGGINPSNLSEFLAVKTVACVGGSWIAEAADLRAGNWGEIERRAREASRVGRSTPP